MSDAQPAKILASYHYHRSVDFDRLAEKAAPIGLMVLADCGAFSALTQGFEVDLDSYAAWTRCWEHRLLAYPNLDVIGNAEATWANHQRMRRDRRPIPVVHYPSRMAVLQRYLDAGERYVALGNLVSTTGGSRSERLRWATACFKHAEPYGAVFHGFGYTNLTALRALPFYSTDSSSNSSASRFGTVPVFDGRRMIGLARGRPKELYRHADLLRAHGVTAKDLDGRTPRQESLIYRSGVIAFRRIEEYLRRLHGPVQGGRPGDPPGPHIFLVSTGPNLAANFINAAVLTPGPYFS